MARPYTAPALGSATSSILRQSFRWNKKTKKPSVSKRRRDLDRLKNSLRSILQRISEKERAVDDLQKGIDRMGLRVRNESNKAKDNPDEVVGGSYQSCANQKKYEKRLEVMRERNAMAIRRLNKSVGLAGALRARINRLRREKMVYLRSFRDLKQEASAKQRWAKQAEEDFVNLNAVRCSIKERSVAFRATFRVQEEKLVTRCAELETVCNELVADIMRLRECDKAGDNIVEEHMEKVKSSQDYLRRSSVRESVSTFSLEKAKNPKLQGGYYVNLWHNIMARTGVKTSDEMVLIFMNLEEQKVARARDINNLHLELKSLQADQKALEDDRASYINDNRDKVMRRKDFIPKLEAMMDRFTSKTTTLREEMDRYNAWLQSAVPHIKALFQALNEKNMREDMLTPIKPEDCPSEEEGLQNEEAEDSKDNNNNNIGTPKSCATVPAWKIKKWFSLIEQRSIEWVQIYSGMLQINKADPRKIPVLKRPMISTSSIHEDFSSDLIVALETVKLNENGSSDDTAARVPSEDALAPLSRKEMNKHAKKKLEFYEALRRKKEGELREVELKDWPSSASSPRSMERNSHSAGGSDKSDKSSKLSRKRRHNLNP